MSTIPVGHPLRSAPRVDGVSLDGIPSAAPLATPEVRTLLGYTRRPLNLPDKHTMAVFSFSYVAPANWVFLVDSRDLSSKRYPVPNNDIASHGAALGTDGNIYIMPYNTARAYRFDTVTREFETLPTDVPEGEYTWDAIGGQNGNIYFGTYPNAIFGEYNPTARTWQLWPHVVPNTKYVTNFSVDSEGRIHFKVWGPGEAWMVFDPQTRSLAEGSQPLAVPSAANAVPEGDESFTSGVSAGDREFGVSYPTGRFWELASGQPPLRRGDTGFPAEPVWWLKATPHEILGVSYYGGLFRFDLATGAFTTGQLDNRAPAGNAIMFLETITPNCVIGANYSQQNLFRVDPGTGAIEEAQTVVARVPGEPMCAVGFGGKAYIGIYVQSLISVYDPSRPFAFRKNPHELIELGREYEQTRPRAAVTDGNLVYLSSDSSYNHLGGALAVIDPATDHIDVYHQMIPDQNLPTLAYDASTRLLWGGTDRWGQMRSHPPTQESAVIYAFDPQTRKVVATVTPWPGADLVNVLGVSADGILIASKDNDLALIETKTREILYQGPMPAGIAGKVPLGSDGLLYGLGNGMLYQWSTELNRLKPVARAPDCVFLTEPSRNLWLLASHKSIYRIEL